MSKVRDTRRTAVYEAESIVRKMLDRADERGLRTVEVAGSHVTLPVERRFASIASVQEYIDAVLALDWVRARWERAAIARRVEAFEAARRAGKGLDDAAKWQSRMRQELIAKSF